MIYVYMNVLQAGDSPDALRSSTLMDFLYFTTIRLRCVLYVDLLWANGLPDGQWSPPPFEYFTVVDRNGIEC